MKVLVLGGTRFFGKRLVEKWIDAGAEVTIATRGKTPDPFGENVRRVIVDRSSLDSLEEVLGSGKWDVVYDQIAYSPDDAWHACEVFEGKIDRYIFTSSMSVYEQSEEPNKEEAFNPDHYPLRTGGREDFSYGEGKKLAETVFAQKATFPVTSVRFPIVLGPDDYTERLLFHVEHIRDGKPILMPNLKAHLSFISSEEAAAFLYWAGTSSFHGPVNACASEDIALGKLINWIEETVDNKAVITSESGDPSPFGIEKSWTMDNKRATAAGFSFSKITDWLPGLIQTLADSE